jgi:glutaminyl-peptide cyclotransferase
VRTLLLSAPLVVAAVLVTGLARRPGFIAAQAPAPIPTFGYTIVNTYPHDRDAYTQGLQYVDGVLYEGTGLNGQSSLRRVNLQTGEVLQRRSLSSQYFGEGITVWGDEIFQLTWQSGVAFVYDRATFTPKRSYNYRGEGWGLTRDATQLIMSDGTSDLRFIDPATFAERRRVRVTANGQPVEALNELEYIKGEVLANIYQTDMVARIDPSSGRLTGWVDFRGLLAPRDRHGKEDVLNGIAYDAAGDRLFVTGKLWAKLYEVRLVPRR